MSIDKLTEQEWQTNEAIARRLNVVIEAVEALRRQFEQHIAAADGADPDARVQIPAAERATREQTAAESVSGLDLDAIVSRGAALAESLYCCEKLSYEDEWQALTGDIPALIWEVRSLRAERDAAQARVAELEALYQAGQDYANARCQERSELVAEIDKWKAKAKALEPDAALGALVRRMHRRVIVERLRDGTYSVGLRGEPRVYFRDEERTFAWAADAALGEE